MDGGPITKNIAVGDCSEQGGSEAATDQETVEASAVAKRSVNDHAQSERRKK